MNEKVSGGWMRDDFAGEDVRFFAFCYLPVGADLEWDPIEIRLYRERQNGEFDFLGIRDCGWTEQQARRVSARLIREAEQCLREENAECLT